MSHRVKYVEKYLPQIYDALPGPSEEPIDYAGMRIRVSAGLETIQCALKVLVADHRAEALRGGLRGRKVFRRTTPCHSAVAPQSNREGSVGEEMSLGMPV